MHINYTANMAGLWVAGLLLILMAVPTVARGQEAGVDLCEGITCSGHGVCVAAKGQPFCACAAGYIPDLHTGLDCLAAQPTPVAEPVVGSQGPVIVYSPSPAVDYTPSGPVYLVQLPDPPPKGIAPLIVGSILGGVGLCYGSLIIAGEERAYGEDVVTASASILVGAALIVIGAIRRNRYREWLTEFTMTRQLVPLQSAPPGGTL